MIEEESESEVDAENAPDIPAELNPFWKKNAEKIVGESLSVIEDTAKQFVVVTGLLQGIYFHAIAFSDIKTAEGYSILIYISPLFLWFLSLLFALKVLLRKKYDINVNSTRKSKEEFERMVKVKYRYIQISGVFLVLSFLALAVAILRYLDFSLLRQL